MTQGALARKLGVTQGMVGHWIHGRSRVTAEMALQIEVATDGKVRRCDLRPDLFVSSGEAAAA